MLSKPMGEDLKLHNGIGFCAVIVGEGLKLRNGIGFCAVILSEAKNPWI